MEEASRDGSQHPHPTNRDRTTRGTNTTRGTKHWNLKSEKCMQTDLDTCETPTPERKLVEHLHPCTVHRHMETYTEDESLAGHINVPNKKGVSISSA